jgi:hypothetical protein
VIHHRKGEIGATNFAAFGAQSGEGLWRSALVNQVTVNIYNAGLAGLFMNQVRIPDFLVKGFGWHEWLQPILALVRGSGQAGKLNGLLEAGW